MWQLRLILQGSVHRVGTVSTSAFLLVLLLSSALSAAPDGPEIGALSERIARSLGGETGGSKVLEASPRIEFAFRRTIKETSSGRTITAEHRYVRLQDSNRIRLDIRLVDGKGKDSATVIEREQAWLVVDGEVHEVELAAAIKRLKDFTPERLYAVPLALAAEGREILGSRRLSLVGRVRDQGQSRFILVGRGPDNEETARIEVDARTYRPVEIAFRSGGGNVVYRYGDYREVAPGLVLPFEREFLRDGIRVSRTEVRYFEVEVGARNTLFDRNQTHLPALNLPGSEKRRTGQ